MTVRRTRRKLKPVPGRQMPAMPDRLLGPRALKDREFRETVGAVEFAVDARYAWDAGVAVSGYLRGLKAGRIMARTCRQCRRVLVPPRMFCEQCFRPTDRWVQVHDTGRVNTFSVCYIRWDMEPLREPEIPAVLEIDGASQGIGFMHKLGEVRPDAVAVGLEVEAVWKPEEEREGSILDIRYFRPRDPALRAGGARARRASVRRAPGRRKKAAGGNE